MFFPIAPQKHRVIDIPKASPAYSIRVDITPEDASEEPLQGPATVMIISRATHKTIQTIRMPSVAIFKDQVSTSVGRNGKQPQLYDDQYSFVFEDFNFDGYQDLAICKDIEGSYGSMSYDIFLWNPAKKQFVKDAQLSKLSSEHLGLLEVDQKKRELITYDKSGAAWHMMSAYRLVKGRPLLVQTVEDDATNGVHDVVTTKTLIGKHWKKKMKTVPIVE